MRSVVPVTVRTPLHLPTLSDALTARGLPAAHVRVSESTGSTNVDLAAWAAAGAPEGALVTTDLQTAGKGRLGRTWVAPAASGVFASVLLRPSDRGIDPARWGWLPLLTGLAIVEVVAALGVPAQLKWPNDVVVGDRKLAGILVERHEPAGERGVAVVVGAGINVSLTEAELPVPTATSLLVEGVDDVAREALLAAYVDRLLRRVVAFADADGHPGRSGLARDYADACTSIGREVVVSLPDGRVLRGLAERVDDDGRLVVAGQAVAAGDVVHVRSGDVVSEGE